MDPKEMFTEVVENVAKMCAVSAMTAPKSGGQLFLKGSKPFIETTIVKDKETLHHHGEGRSNLIHRSGEMVSADVRLRRVRLRHLQRIPSGDCGPSCTGVRGLG